MTRNLMLRGVQTLGRALALMLAATAFPLGTAFFVAGILAVGLTAATLHVRRCALRDGWLAEV